MNCTLGTNNQLKLYCNMNNTYVSLQIVQFFITFSTFLSHFYRLYTFHDVYQFMLIPLRLNGLYQSCFIQFSFFSFCCLLTFPFKDSAAYVVLKYFLILKVVDYGINFTIKNFIANNLYGLTKENTGTYKTNVQNIYLQCTSGVRIDFHACVSFV